nr:hypothetical protein GCM10020093_034980 [Planobispora longispora]
MSYEEKGVWVYLVVSLGTYAAYLAVILGRAGGGPSPRSPTCRRCCGASASPSSRRSSAASASPSPRRSPPHRRRDRAAQRELPERPRDKDINRFGEYVGGGVFAVAMLVPFALAVVEADHFWIANAMYASFVLTALVSSCAKLVAYRRGL